MNILFASQKEKPEFWFPLLQKALPADRFFAWPDINGGDIDVAVVATHPRGTFANLRKLKLIQSMWMGVENIVNDPDLPRGVPVARLIDPGMVAAIHSADVHAKLEALGMEPTGLGPAELARIHKADYDKWGPVIKASGFKPES